MKQYLLILLAALGVGAMISSTSTLDFTEKKSDTVAEIVSEMPDDDAAFLSSISVSELAQPLDAELEELESTPVMTYDHTLYNTSQVAPAKSANVNAPTSGTPNFTVTIRDDSQVVKSPSYTDIYRFNNMIYAHNTSNLFGALGGYTPGMIFNITENGLTTTYRVSEVRVFQKINDSTLYLCYNNNYADCHGSNQLTLIAVNSSYISESLTLTRHAVALMTCSGNSYGNGDASHRLVIFADAV